MQHCAAYLLMYQCNNDRDHLYYLYVVLDNAGLLL